VSRKAYLRHQAQQCDRAARTVWLGRLQHVASHPVPTYGHLSAEEASRSVEDELLFQARECRDELQEIADTEHADRVWPPEEPYWRGDF